MHILWFKLSSSIPVVLFHQFWNHRDLSRKSLSWYLWTWIPDFYWGEELFWDEEGRMEMSQESFFKKKFIYLTVLGLSCSMQTLSCSMWDLVPWSGIRLGPLLWERRVLAIGPPGKSLTFLSCVWAHILGKFLRHRKESVSSSFALSTVWHIFKSLKLQELGFFSQVHLYLLNASMPSYSFSTHFWMVPTVPGLPCSLSHLTKVFTSHLMPIWTLMTRNYLISRPQEDVLFS